MERAPEDSGGVGMRNELKLEGLYRLENGVCRAPCPLLAGHLVESADVSFFAWCHVSYYEGSDSASYANCLCVCGCT